MYRYSTSADKRWRKQSKLTYFASACVCRANPSTVCWRWCQRVSCRVSHAGDPTQNNQIHVHVSSSPHRYQKTLDVASMCMWVSKLDCCVWCVCTSTALYEIAERFVCSCQHGRRMLREIWKRCCCFFSFLPLFTSPRLIIPCLVYLKLAPKYSFLCKLVGCWWYDRGVTCWNQDAGKVGVSASLCTPKEE